MSDAEIRKTALNAGWKDSDVEEAFAPKSITRETPRTSRELKIWITLTVIFLMLFWAGLLGGSGYLPHTITSSDLYVVFILGAGILFAASLIMSIFTYYRLKGGSGLQAVAETGRSMVRMSILWYLIGGVIVGILFFNLIHSIGMTGICELGLNFCFK